MANSFMAGRGRQVFHAVTLVIGVVALALLVRELGWEGMRAVVVGTGPLFLAIAAIDVASVLCDAGGVYSFVRPQAPIGYGRVFVAQVSGLAINRLTPGNSMGEPVKVTMLVEHVPATAAVSAIVMFNLATIGVAVAVIAIGTPVTLLLLDPPARLRAVVIIAALVLVGVAIALGVLARRGALGTLVGAARRLRVISAERAVAWRGRVAPIDAQVAVLGRPGARRGIVFAALSRVLHAVGTVVVMDAAGVPLTAPLVVATLSVGILITWVSNVIPLGLGIADTSHYALYGALGAMGPLGLVFAMINRMRTCVLAIIGLTVMGVASALRQRDRR